MKQGQTGVATPAGARSDTRSGCVPVGLGHPRLSEGLRDWLQASFDAVFVVADRPSLIAGTGKLQPGLVFADLALAGADGVLQESALATDLVDAIDSVLAGRRFATPGDLP